MVERRIGVVFALIFLRSKAKFIDQTALEQDN